MYSIVDSPMSPDFVQLCKMSVILSVSATTPSLINLNAYKSIFFLHFTDFYVCFENANYKLVIQFKKIASASRSVSVHRARA